MDGKRRKKNMICGARTSVIEERGCNEVYIFLYACRWAKSFSYVFSDILVGSE